MKAKELCALVCDEAWPQIRGKKTQPNPLACVECESMCLGGVELLKQIPDDQFVSLLCGGDCDTCRQPCNMRRIALARKLKPPAVREPKPRTVRKRRKPRSIPWIWIAMRPYNERHEIDNR